MSKKGNERFSLWREITIPPHRGAEDLIKKIEKTGMHIERWAEGLLRATPIEFRAAPAKRRIARLSNLELGLKTSLVSIAATKNAGLSQGLEFLQSEDILALRLEYSDQKPEWMRVAMKEYVDEDQSILDFAIVNDGARCGIRTTWGFPQNVFQSRHEWFWVLPDGEK